MVEEEEGKKKKKKKRRSSHYIIIILAAVVFLLFKKDNFTFFPDPISQAASKEKDEQFKLFEAGRRSLLFARLERHIWSTNFSAY